MFIFPQFFPTCIGHDLLCSLNCMSLLSNEILQCGLPFGTNDVSHVFFKHVVEISISSYEKCIAIYAGEWKLALENYF